MEIYLIFFGIPFWVLFCIIAAVAGAKRKIGGFEAFLVSFFFSPFAGLILVALSKRVQDEEYENAVLANQSQIISLLQNTDDNKISHDEL